MLASLLSFALMLNIGSTEDKKLTPMPEIPLKGKLNITYEKDVEPIFEGKCIVCHSGNVIESKFDMSTYASLMKGGKRGAVIIPGKAKDSFLYRVSAHMEKPVMPLKGEDPLTPEELATLKVWIDEGAKPPVAGKERKPVPLKAEAESIRRVLAVAISQKAGLVFASQGNRVLKFGFPSLTAAGEFPADSKPAHPAPITSLAVSPNGKILATGSFREFAIWELDTGKLILRQDGFADNLLALTFSPDSKQLAVAGGAATEDGELQLFNLETMQKTHDWRGVHTDSIFGVCFSPDGKMLATASADKNVKILDLESKKLLKTLEGHTHHVLDVSWRRDGKFIASAGAEGIVKLWDVARGEQQRSIAAHKNQVTRIRFIGEKNEYITTSGEDGIRLWNNEATQPTRNFLEASEYWHTLASSEDGKWFVTGGENGKLQLYEAEVARPKQTTTLKAKK